jgi:hypothetical protein
VYLALSAQTLMGRRHGSLSRPGYLDNSVARSSVCDEGSDAGVLDESAGCMTVAVVVVVEVVEAENLI